MTTLNAKASEAWNLAEAESEFGFESDQDAFEEGWETGYKAATQEMCQWLRGKRADAITGERQNAYEQAIQAVEELAP